MPRSDRLHVRDQIETYIPVLLHWRTFWRLAARNQTSIIMIMARSHRIQLVITIRWTENRRHARACANNCIDISWLSGWLQLKTHSRSLSKWLLRYMFKRTSSVLTVANIRQAQPRPSQFGDILSRPSDGYAFFIRQSASVGCDTIQLCLLRLWTNSNSTTHSAVNSKWWTSTMVSTLQRRYGHDRFHMRYQKCKFCIFVAIMLNQNFMTAIILNAEMIGCFIFAVLFHG